MDRVLLERLTVAGLLLFIVLFSFYIRSMNNVPDRMLGYDPIFQYRFTKYFVDFGQLPAWDELSYYTGRTVLTSAPPLMFYLTALIYFFTKGLGWSLITTATFASAVYGAAIAIPAFLLARELSNKWGGLMGATLTATAPQILVRTFGASFDTDQIAIFFILFTLWAGIYAIKRRTVFAGAVVVAAFTLFMLAWQTFWYTFFFLVLSVVLYALMLMFGQMFKHKRPLGNSFKTALNRSAPLFIFAAAIFVAITTIGFLLQLGPIESFFNLVGFAQKAEIHIVNISIAELQLINIADIGTWMVAMGRFFTGDQMLDGIYFTILVLLMFFGLYRTGKTDTLNFAFILSIVLIAFYTLTRGIRFTEFSSGLFIAVAAAGFGHIVSWSADKDRFLKGASIGIGLYLAVFAMFMGLYVAQFLGPSTNSNWDSAWAYLRTQTPELSLIGTWWDPGHMITGLAERRVIADGAHCPGYCLYGINARITDLGRTMATTDENESLRLINKYVGTSPKVYWIASDDLISKYQWLQYFGLGCNARTDPNCQLYSLIGIQDAKADQSGNIVVRIYGPIMMLSSSGGPVPIYTQGRNAVLIEEVIYYDGQAVKVARVDADEQAAIIQSAEPVMEQLGFRMSNQTIPLTVWLSEGQNRIVIIPPNLRNTVFTRMFFLEGQGLEHFEQVFRNEQVKIYEVEL